MQVSAFVGSQTLDCTKVAPKLHHHTPRQGLGCFAFFTGGSGILKPTKPDMAEMGMSGFEDQVGQKADISHTAGIQKPTKADRLKNSSVCRLL